MTRDEIATIIATDVPREALLDMTDELIAGETTSRKCISEGTKLKGKRASRASGFVRFLVNEDSFERVALAHGGAPLSNGMLPVLDLKVHQPYHLFGDRTLFGFASSGVPGDLPKANKSRSHASQLNLEYEPHLDVMGTGSDKIFALLVSSRWADKQDGSMGIRIAVISHNYDHFLLDEPLEVFLARYADLGNIAGTEARPSGGNLVQLRKSPKIFRPGERRDETDDGTSDQG